MSSTIAQDIQDIKLKESPEIRNVVNAKDIFLSFGGHHLLTGVSFTLKPGQITLLRGDNGSGKTTLLNILTGFLRPDSGQILINFNGSTIDVAHTSPEYLAGNGVGRLWQDIRLFPTMTVLENVLAGTSGLTGLNPAFALAIWPVVRKQERDAKERAFSNLELVGMVDRAKSSCDKLSLGQMKRVAIARLLQTGADIFMLDEPLAGLDKESVKSFLDLLTTLSHKEDKTLLIIEHKHEHIEKICDKTFFLAEGKLCRNGEKL